jgi:MFS family permease
LGVLETPAFQRLLAQKRVEQAPVLEVIRRQPKEIVLAALAKTGEIAPAYIYLAFVFVYGSQVLHVGRDFILSGVIAGCLLSFVVTPLSGYLSDRIGRKRMYLLSATGMGIFGFIYFAMLNSLVPALMFIGIVLSWMMHGLMYGPQAALIAEALPHDCAIVAARWVIISPLSQAAAPHHSLPRSCWLPPDQRTRLPRTSPFAL